MSPSIEIFVTPQRYRARPRRNHKPAEVKPVLSLFLGARGQHPRVVCDSRSLSFAVTVELAARRLPARAQTVSAARQQAGTPTDAHPMPPASAAHSR